MTVILTPTQLTAYRRRGWKVFQPGFDITYKSQWSTPWFFIREFFQNALDEHDSVGISGQLPKLENGRSGVVIEDQGRGLGAESLLLREVKGEGDLRGRFGEGLKFACIAAVRLGYTPVIESPSVLIEAHISPVTMGKVEANLLTFIYKESERTRTGTMVTIEGYRGELYRDRFTQFIGEPITSRERKVGRFMRQSSVYLNPKGRLYVGDIFIRQFTHPTDYSYNLWEIPLNPDRISEIDPTDVHEGMSYAWSHLDTVALAVRLLKAMTTEDSEESRISWSWPVDREMMVKAWEQVFGRAVLWTSERDSKLAEGYGYKTVGQGWTSNTRYMLRSYVPIDSAVVDVRVKELSGPRVIAETNLTDTQQRNLNVIRFLTDNCPRCVWEGGKPKIKAATIAGDPRLGMIVQGLCSYDDATLYLSASTLNTEEGTLATFYHEMGHWVGGVDAVDASTAHTKAVQDVAGHISLLILQKTADIKRILGVVERVEKMERPRGTPVGVGVPSPAELLHKLDPIFEEAKKQLAGADYQEFVTLANHPPDYLRPEGMVLYLRNWVKKKVG